MLTLEVPPIYLTILRQGDRNIIDLAEVGSLIPRSETRVDDAFLQELAEEWSRLALPGYGRGLGQESQDSFPVREPSTVMHGLQHLGGLIFSHLLTEPARVRLRTASPCALYLRLDEQLLSVPWELGFDGESFLATKFCVGRQVITGHPLPGLGARRTVDGPLTVLLIADPTESLPQAREEAEQLHEILDGMAGFEVTLVGGKNVRKLPLLAALQAHDVVHFAGHSFYDPVTPSQSGWCLREGILTAGELSKLSRPPLLVFSNSCQAGATAVWQRGYHYEGQAFGIGSAFLLAGVQHYIGTFWVIHDEESIGFATAFYQNLATRQSLGTALLEARRAVLHQRGGVSLTWASYLLYGDPTVSLLPAKSEPSHSDLASTEGKRHSRHYPPESEPLPRPQRRVPRSFSARPLGLIIGVAAGVLVIIFLLTRLDHRVPEGPLPPAEMKAVGVMLFKALSPDPELEWMREAIRDNLNSQLNSTSDLKVYSKEHIDFLVKKGASTEIEVANKLGITKMISGSFLAIGNILHIEAHIVDVRSGFLEISDSVEGEPSNFFNLQGQLALKIMAHLNVAVSPREVSVVPSTSSASTLDAYKLLLEAEGETRAARPPKAEDSAPHDSPSKKQDKHSLAPPWQPWPSASVAWADEALSQGVAREEEVRQMLEKYRQAYEKKDLTLLESVYDALTPAQKEANVKYFQNTQKLQVTIRDVDIVVKGNEAVASYTREDQFVDAKTGQNVKLEVRFTKVLERKDGSWRIVVGEKSQ